MAAPSASRSFRFLQPPRPPLPSPASLELTASDGTGLRLVSLEARVVLEDPLAFTELRLTFHNPARRRLEGRFRIGLPPGASVSRFAMKIGGQWQEGEVVERQAARRIYEDFLHRSQDPALLEQEAGNEFSARVFPIEADEHKELILSYGHELAHPGEPYRLPLLGLPELGSLSIRALVGRREEGAAASSLGGQLSGVQVVEVRRENWRPDQDFELKPPASGRSGLRHGDLVLLRARPPLPEEPDEIRSLLVLIDSSASRALCHERQLALVLGLLRALADGAGLATPVRIACFDQEVVPLFDGPIGDFSAQDEARLRARLPLGASDLAAALRWAAEQPAGVERVLLVTDGVNTAGQDDAVEATRVLAARGVQRLDAVVLGGLRDEASLRRLVTAGLPRDGVVCDGERSLDEIADRLTRATGSGIAVEIPGASWTWPTRLDGVQSGEDCLIYAQLPASTEPRLLLGGTPVPLGPLTPAERPLLERAWVKARIEALEDLRARAGGNRDVAEAMLRQIIELSTRHRVLCAHTALLVLESEEDYARYNLDRRSLADILTVGLSGMEVLHRTSASPPPLPAPPPPPSLDALAKTKADSFEKKSRRLMKRARPPANKRRPLREEREEGAYEEARMEVARDDEPMGLSAPEVASRDEPEGVCAQEADFSDEDELFAFNEGAGAEDSSLMPMAELAAPEPEPLAAAPAPAFNRAAPAPMAPPPPAPVPAPAYAPPAAPPPEERPREQGALPPGPDLETLLESWEEPFRSFMELLLRGKGEEAMAAALRWREQAPGDVLALVALGKAATALGDTVTAARAYGSLIDLFPARADLRRFAGELLSSLPAAVALALAIDTFRKAVESRPDHPSGHHLLGMALLRAGRPAEAFEAIARGQARAYPPKFPGVDRILAEDLGLAAAAWIRSDPKRREELLARLRKAEVPPEDGPSVRFVLVWETDANDVDFHIHDPFGGHAYFRERQLPSGGELYADVTQGYGPECFTIRGPAAGRAYPYRLQAHYYSRGPMGYGMGSLQIIEHNGQGELRFEERPYVIQEDGAYVDLGIIEGPLASEEPPRSLPFRSSSWTAL